MDKNNLEEKGFSILDDPQQKIVRSVDEKTGTHVMIVVTCNRPVLSHKVVRAMEDLAERVLNAEFED